jgi:hypothetical protein
VAQRYQKLVQEDLNVGTEAVWVTAPGGGDLRTTQVGIHTVARGQVAYESAWTPGAIAAGSNATTTVSVPDAATGDFVVASHDKILTNPLRISGHVSVAGTATVIIHNPTASSITVAAGTVRVVVFPAIGVNAPTATGTVTGTVYFNIIGGVAVGAGVAVTLPADGLSTVTNGSGEYSMTGATPGDATVYADDGGGNTGNNTGTVVAIDIAISGI